MSNSLAEDYPELFHYTDAAGLNGIIKTQTLWATHYKYLNDAEEVGHYFNDRLPNVLKGITTNSNGNNADEAIEHRITAWRKTLLESDDPLAEPYITSFCKTNDEKVKEHGLLSQWRGYGQRGGYAIVFETSGLMQLLKKESEKNWGVLLAGDVIYSSDDPKNIHKEFEEGERVIQNFYLNQNDPESQENIDFAIMQCACRYKHWGFEEEKEVRIVAIPHNKRTHDYANEEDGITKQQLEFFIRSGTPVPYVALFDGITLPPKKCLPIKRIIVGPHPNKNERVRAVEILLDQYGIKAKVSPSEIPYLG